MSPFTRVTLRIFATGFYRVHSGLLIASLVTVVSYCFFINLLDENHVSKEEQVLHHLGIVLGLLSSPVMVALIFVIWLFITIKSWSYVTAQLNAGPNHFLKYSSTALPRMQQFGSWFIVQLVISMPMMVYAAFAGIIGLIFGYYLVPFLVASYIVLLAVISAALYVAEGNKMLRSGEVIVFSLLAKTWPKPLFSLPLYALADRQKIALVFTKIISLAILAGIAMLFSDLDRFKTAAVAAMGIATAHVLILWQWHVFERQFLTLTRNFPISLTQRYAEKAAAITLLVLPESSWMVIQYGWTTGLFCAILTLTFMLLCSGALYRKTPDMRRFLYLVFFLFNLLFLTILLGWIAWTVPALLLVSYGLFVRDFNRPAE